MSIGDAVLLGKPRRSPSVSVITVSDMRAVRRSRLMKTRVIVGLK
ncbi:MAG: hypothetical protein U0521_06490 [Anaerolineae bacterium]